MNAAPMEWSHADLERLQWHCRRGKLELDLVLQQLVLKAFGDDHLNRVWQHTQDREVMHERLLGLRDLLEHEDTELMDWLLNNQWQQCPSHHAAKLLQLMS